MIFFPGLFGDRGSYADHHGTTVKWKGDNA
jgi:hypothetical protein